MMEKTTVFVVTAWTAVVVLSCLAVIAWRFGPETVLVAEPVLEAVSARTVIEIGDSDEHFVMVASSILGFGEIAISPHVTVGQLMTLNEGKGYSVKLVQRVDMMVEDRLTTVTLYRWVVAEGVGG